MRGLYPMARILNTSSAMDHSKVRSILLFIGSFIGLVLVSFGFYSGRIFHVAGSHHPLWRAADVTSSLNHMQLNAATSMNDWLPVFYIFNIMLMGIAAKWRINDHAPGKSHSFVNAHRHVLTLICAGLNFAYFNWYYIICNYGHLPTGGPVEKEHLDHEANVLFAGLVMLFGTSICISGYFAAAVEEFENEAAEAGKALRVRA